MKCNRYNFYNHYNRYRMCGFTIIELILVVSIISILMVLYSSVGVGFLNRNSTENFVNQFLSSLRTAQTNSVSGKRDSSWGVYVSANEVVLYKGSSYAAREAVFDEKFSIPGSVGIAPSSEVVFSKLAGETNAAVYTITNNVGQSYTININQLGNVDLN